MVDHRPVAVGNAVHPHRPGVVLRAVARVPRRRERLPGAQHSSNRFFSYAVKELADWLAAHPNEMIFLILNGEQGDQSGDWEAILTHYIPAQKFFTPSDWSAKSQWPTMRD